MAMTMPRPAVPHAAGNLARAIAIMLAEIAPQAHSLLLPQ